MRTALPVVIVAVTAALIILATPQDSTPAPTGQPKVATKAKANELIRRQPGFFVPNLGQWEHPARFVHKTRRVCGQSRSTSLPRNCGASGGSARSSFRS